MQVLIKPIVTEKMTALGEAAQKQYGFVVDLDANKLQIKKAIEETYGVTVVNLRTAIQAARRRTRYTRTGFIHGKTSRTKRAYVTLAAGQEIDFYKNA